MADVPRLEELPGSRLVAVLASGLSEAPRPEEPLEPELDPGLDPLDDPGELARDARQVQLAADARVRTADPGESRSAPPAPAPAAEPAATPLDQIVRTAHLLRQEGRTEMRLRLEPPALGWVRVSVTASGETLALHIDAERADTQALLTQALPDLQRALVSRGLEVASLTVRMDFETAKPRGGPDRPSERARRADARERPGTRAGVPASSPLPRVDLTI